MSGNQISEKADAANTLCSTQQEDRIMNTISIIAVTESADGVMGFTCHIIKELKKCSETIVVLNGNESSELRAAIEALSVSIAASSGKSYAELYRSGTEYAVKHGAAEADRLLFAANDFFGPFRSFEEIMSEADEKLPSVDIWSLADISGNLCKEYIDPSFFAVNTGKLPISQLCGFFEKCCGAGSKSGFCSSFNDMLSSLKLSRGFLYETHTNVHSNALNVLELVSSGFPVLFTDTLTESCKNTLSTAMSANVKEAVDYIACSTDYDTGLIWEYTVKNTDPFELLSALGNHFVISDRPKEKPSHRSDTVMVFHSFYSDLMDENIARLNEIAKVCDVIITTTSKEKQEILQEKLSSYDVLSGSGTRILISEGNGRDMAGLLVEARPYLSGYKYIGFTHDKKSAHHQQLSGEAFKDIITENIISSAGYAENVISLFEQDSRLGLLVPPPPEHGSYFAVIGRRWCENFEYYKSLCDKLGIPVNTSPQSSSFALGTAFWCRYDALKDLFEYEWRHSDFPPEPLPLNGSISHALERSFPYDAKKNGYYSGIIYSEKMASQFLNIREYMLTDFMTLMNSRISAMDQTLASYEKKVEATVKKPREAVKTTAVQNYKSHSISRSIMRALGRKMCAAEIKKNISARILVILHLFYMSGWKEIKEYLKNLEPYRYDLVVAYTENFSDKTVLQDIRGFKPGVVLKPCQNLGYDIGSYTEILSETDLSAYDIIFKLHSKGVNRRKIYIYGNYLKKRDWFLNLYEGCIGPVTVHKTINRLINDPKTGLVAAKDLIVADPRHKQNMVKAFMRENDIPIPDKYLFVAGTCFAVRAELMRPIADMHLNVSDYRSAGAEFSLAHKMERLICLTVLSSGYDFYGNNVLILRRALRKLSVDYKYRKKYSGMRLLDDKRFELDDEFVYFSLEHRLVRKYELVDIPLKDIRRRWADKDIPLAECPPYRYLVTGDPQVYEDYCSRNKLYFDLDIMSRERFDELIASIEQNGFDKRNVVVVNGQNIIMDGQHRCCYMLYKYGEDYKIPCLRIYEMSPLKQGLINFCNTHLSKKNTDRLKQIYHKLLG